MKEQSADTMNNRVTVKALIKYAHDISREKQWTPQNEVERKVRETGERIRSCTVHGFYEAFIIDRVSNEDEYQSEQEWIDDCIAVMLGEENAPALTMRDLASGIAEKMGQEDLSDEDRWALYELCFLLTAQMSKPDGKVFGARHQCSRLGTPDKAEPHSLYWRVKDYRRNAEAKAVEARPKVRVSMDDLLRCAGGGDHVLSEHTRLSLPDLKVGPVLDCLLTAKYDLDTNDQFDSFRLFERSSRFSDMFNMYTGQEWSNSHTITELATMMTWMFWLKVKDADSEDIDHACVLQAYELCYEFINVLASPDHDAGHVSLMVREGLHSRYDVDEKTKAKILGTMDATE